MPSRPSCWPMPSTANGQPAADFEIRKRQVQAISDLAYSKGTRTLVLPAEVAGVLGSLDTLVKLVAPKSGQMPQ